MSSRYEAEPEFQKLLAGRQDVDLVRLLLELAEDRYPGYDRGSCLVELDRLGAAASERLLRRCEACAEDRLAEISRLLYVEEGFCGNDSEYYDPRNSYLNEVLTRRCGIPISLGIVYYAVARRAGLAIMGVNTPGHFVLRSDASGRAIFVDPFHHGEVMDLDRCRKLVSSRLGEDCALDDACFEPASVGTIAVRVLRNLKTAYALVDDWLSVLPVQERLTALRRECPEERRDLGLVCLRVGQPHRALELLEEYVSNQPAEAAQAVVPFVRTARRVAAELN